MRPWIRSYLFSWIFAPGGRLSYEAYTFLSKSKVPKMYFLGASASQNGLKGTNTRLKQLSEQFWVAEKHTKGGGGLRPLPPLCMFFGSQNSSNCCLRSRIFSFQSILACRGSQKLHFGDLGLT